MCVVAPTRAMLTTCGSRWAHSSYVSACNLLQCNIGDVRWQVLQAVHTDAHEPQSGTNFHRICLMQASCLISMLSACIQAQDAFSKHAIGPGVRSPTGRGARAAACAASP